MIPQSRLCLWPVLLVLPVATAAAEIQTLTAQHTLRITEGKCAEHHTPSCTPEPSYGPSTGITLDFAPQGASAACPDRVSGVGGYIKAAGATADTALPIEYAFDTNGCGYRACFSVGGTFSGNILDTGGPYDVTLSWQVNGHAQTLTQRLLLTKKPYGRYALEWAQAPLLSKAAPPPAAPLWQAR